MIQLHGPWCKLAFNMYILIQDELLVTKPKERGFKVFVLDGWEAVHFYFYVRVLSHLGSWSGHCFAYTSGSAHVSY